MSNTDNTNSTKTVKEKTVKKRAARSIVAPRADEEISSREMRRQDAFAGMNTAKSPRRINEAASTVRSPGAMKVTEIKDNKAKMVTAPINLNFNEDILQSAPPRKQNKIIATGWPDRPPAPRNANVHNSPETVEKVREQGPGPVIVTGVTSEGQIQPGQGQGQTVPPQRQIQPGSVQAASQQRQMQPGRTAPQQRQMQPGQAAPPQKQMQQGPVISTGTVSEGQIPKGPVQTAPQQRQTQPGQTAPQKQMQQGNGRPVPQQGQRRPGQGQRPGQPGPNRGQVRPGQAPQRAMPGRPAQNGQAGGRQQRPPVNTAGNGVNIPVSQVTEELPGGNSSRRVLKTVVTTTTTTTYETVSDEDLKELSGPTQTVVTEQLPVQQIPQTVQSQHVTQQIPQPVQSRHVTQQLPQSQLQQAGQTGRIPTQGQDTAQGSVINRMMSQPPHQGKPMTAMDRQLADIEKALGLSEPGVDNGVNGNINGTVNNNINSNNDMLNASFFEGQGQPNSRLSGGNVPAPGNKQGPAGQRRAAGNDPFKDIDTFSDKNHTAKNEPMDLGRKSTEYMMLAIEGVIFVVILIICLSIYHKIKNRDFDTDDSSVPSTEAVADEGQDNPIPLADSGTEGFEVQEAGADDELLIEDDPSGSVQTEASSESVDVDNDNFTLKCTNVTVCLDTNGNPAALIYFTFTNKTSKLLSMSEVFPPSVTQNGEPCETFASLDEYPEEFYNKDTQISDGSSLDCCYSVSLKDAVSPMMLTVHDNYETFSDVGTTEIPLQ